MIATIVVAAALAATPCRTVRDIDFRNFTYPLREDRFTSGEVWQLKVVNGRFESPHPPSVWAFFYFLVGTVVFGDLTGEGREHAVVPTGYGSTSGNFSVTDIYVFACEDGLTRLESILTEQQIARDSGLDVHTPQAWIAEDHPVAVENGFLQVDFGGRRFLYRLASNGWSYIGSQF